MKKLIKLFVSFLIVISFFCLNGNAEDQKKGSTSGKFSFSGPLTYLSLGNERAHMTYELIGSMIPNSEDTLFRNSSVRCIGALQAIKGHFDDDMGSCFYTDSDGDNFFITYMGKGDIGQGAKGKYEYVGGTGKYTGLSGSGEFTIEPLKPSKEGIFQGISTYKGNWELP